uniref:Putative group vii salivary lipocalin n=1 Tax=Rhipicephalus pulchellus TaxID=72859 RepID=L7M8D7_RHIPC
MTTVKGVSITLLVVLLCWLPPVRMAVGCLNNEKKVPCGPGDIAPVNTCPGVGVSCVFGDQVCGCPGTLYRNDKYKCVEYEDCFTRTYDARAFLEQQDRIYLVGLTGGLFRPPKNRLIKCIRSVRQYTTATKIRRQLFYVEEIQNEEIDQPQERTENNKPWDPKEFALEFRVDNSKKEVRIAVMAKNDPVRIEEEQTFHVVHASTECLIIATVSKSKEYYCTFWARSNAVNRLSESCKTIFYKHCSEPQIFLHRLDEECINQYYNLPNSNDNQETA